MDLRGEDDLVPIPEVDAAHAARDALLDGDLVLGVDAHAAARDHEDGRPLLVGIGGLDGDDAVALVEADRLENRLVDVVLRPERLFDHALLGHDEQIPVPRLEGQDGDGAFVLCGVIEQVVERIALVRELARDLFAADAVAVSQV